MKRLITLGLAMVLLSGQALAASNNNVRDQAIAVRDTARADLTGYHLVRDLTSEVGAHARHAVRPARC